MREFLERNYKDDMSRDETIKLTIKSLLEVVQTGAKNIEIAILEKGKSLEVQTPYRSKSFPSLHRILIFVLADLVDGRCLIWNKWKLW